MSSPEATLLIPTLEDVRISPIESPSSKELYSLYGDMVLDMMGIASPIDDDIRANASRVIDSRFFENPEAQYNSEIWLQGVKALFTSDPIMIKAIVEAETSVAPEDNEELPEVIGIPMSGFEQVQGFFGGFTTGPALDIESELYEYLDFSYCVKLVNPLVQNPGYGPDELPEFMVGNYIAVLDAETEIGTVS